MKAPTRLRAWRRNTPEDYLSVPMDAFPLPARIFMHIAVRVIWIFTKAVCPWTFHEVNRLVQTKEPRVLIMNHSSMLEPVVVVMVGWVHGLKIRAICKQELFSFHPIAAWFFSRIGCIPIERATADMKAVRRARAALEAGECVLIYPEGTRVHRDADSVFHSGFALIAQLCHVPLQPLAIVGARKLHFLSKPHISVGDMIAWDFPADWDRKKQLEAMESRGKDAVIALRDELRERYPDPEEC